MTTSPAIVVHRATTDHNAKVRLLRINLPHFSGNVMMWPVLWDSFKSAVHDNLELNNIDKFNYL